MIVYSRCSACLDGGQSGVCCCLFLSFTSLLLLFILFIVMLFDCGRGGYEEYKNSSLADGRIFVCKGRQMGELRLFEGEIICF